MSTTSSLPPKCPLHFLVQTIIWLLLVVGGRTRNYSSGEVAQFLPLTKESRKNKTKFFENEKADISFFPPLAAPSALSLAHEAL